MAKEFKYDAVTLIELVESKPCLWDKTNEDNKNKILREKSWLEVFQYLEDSYENLTLAEKKKTGDSIMKKWNNIRDAFMRSLRTESGQAAKRNYMYSEHLQFLLKTGKTGDTVNNYTRHEDIDQVRDDVTDNDGEIPSPSQQEESLFNISNPAVLETQPVTAAQSSSRPTTIRSKGGKKRELDVIEKEILTEIKKAKTSSNRSDQEMLLLSFLPYIRDMTEFELMEFQMNVLTNIRSIKQKRSSNVLPNIFQNNRFTVSRPLSSSGSSSAQYPPYQVASPEDNYRLQELHSSSTGTVESCSVNAFHSSMDGF